MRAAAPRGEDQRFASVNLRGGGLRPPRGRVRPHSVSGYGRLLLHRADLPKSKSIPSMTRTLLVVGEAPRPLAWPHPIGPLSRVFAPTIHRPPKRAHDD